MLNLKSFLRIILIVFIIYSEQIPAESQTLNRINISDQAGLNTDSLTLTDSTNLIFKRRKSLLSFLLNEKMCTTGDVTALSNDKEYSQTFENKIRLLSKKSETQLSGWQMEFIFENISADTVTISNVIPFVADNESVNIRGKGPWNLARAWLFRPGYQPVRVILPDNAWELGYTSFEAGEGFSVCALTRRQKTEGGLRQRYQTLLPPNTRVYYMMYADVFRGDWQDGLRKIFRDKYLYDLETFDNSLYERPDLSWIKESYLIILQMAWDREFYDRATGKYTFPDVLKMGIELFDHIDVYGIWPTWPRLGLDQRNQWDLYRDLPGGTAQLRNFSRLSKQYNTKFFIAYNPWDNSTRKEDHYRGMAQLIKETEADGVVLDTRGSSSYELQAAADSVRKGVVMYSEGMAVTRDMPGIISGRVHNAIYLSPELNLNKLIKPDFSIFRVCDVGEDIIHREIAVAFFNGYGTELNLFRPGGKDDDYRADLGFLARTTFILRQNNDAFLDMNWTPLIETTIDSVYVNKWTAGDKIVYTALNMRSEGIDGKLFEIEDDGNKHYVSLWNHENIEPERNDNAIYIPARAEGWPSSFSGTRKEASVDCIAAFPYLLETGIEGDSISLKAPGKSEVIIWKGNPSYSAEFVVFNLSNDTLVSIKDIFGYYEGKIVVQLVDGKHLRDENVHFFKGGKPWLVSSVEPTVRATGIAPGMILIPGADFILEVSSNEDFIPYPEVSGLAVKVDSFLIDKYPVTNGQYYEFLQSSGYRPADTTRYLRHWDMDIYKPGQEKYPVVYLNYEDMKAYAKWAGKRLPTEAEWQLAAQGTDARKWPWGNAFHGTVCNNAFGKSTPVDAFEKGVNQYGVADLVGNVWQMTNDLYFNGSYYFTVIRGGSYFRPESSSWYIQGGPQPLDKTQIMLMVSPGYDRSATVGFRCVKDIDSRNFRGRSR